MKDLDISQVAKRTGIAASKLRYYEEKGLISSSGRRGLKRIFDPSIIERLALINLGRTAGFSLDEIAGMFGADGKPEINRARLVSKAEEIDEMIRRLQVLSTGLHHAAECKAPSHMECPTFRRIVDRAASGRFVPERGLPGSLSP